MAKKPFKKIYIEITDVCNLHCSFCQETTRSPRFMTVSEFEQLCRQAASLTDHICLHVKGEPLMHPALSDLLSCAADHGLNVNLTTNGTLLADRAEVLLNARSLRTVSISLHSIFAGNSSITPKVYMQQVIDFSKVFTKTDRHFISYRLWNLASDTVLADSGTENTWILNTLKSAYGLTQLPKASPGRHAGNKIAPQTFVNFDVRFEWPDMANSDYGSSGTCYGLRSHLAILCDGTVTPCCLDGNGHIPLGNAFSQPLTAITGSKKSLCIAEGFRNRQIHEEFCRRCGYRLRFND